jgi:hypothetical protein
MFSANHLHVPFASLDDGTFAPFFRANKKKNDEKKRKRRKRKGKGKGKGKEKKKTDEKNTRNLCACGRAETLLSAPLAEDGIL